MQSSLFSDLSRCASASHVTVRWGESTTTFRCKKHGHFRDFSTCCTSRPWVGRKSRRQFLFRVSKPSSEQGGDGDKDVQDLLVDLLRLETDKVRVNDFVEDRSKFLTEIAEKANEEFDRIAEDAKKTMDEAGSKVLEQINAEADEFEEELAAARAEMEASEQDLDEFEKKVENARSEGLFFKSLYSKPSKPWKAKSAEEQKEIVEKARSVTEVLDQGTKKAAGSTMRQTVYVVIVLLLTLAVLEGVFSENVQWTKVSVCVVLLVALLSQIVYEKFVSIGSKEEDDKNSS